MCHWRRLTLVMASVVPTILSAADQDGRIGELESDEVRRAIREYTDQLNDLSDRFGRDASAARQRLLSILEQAQTKATMANQLDEAIRIRSLRRAFREDAEPVPAMAEIQVIAAFYGQNISWLDVTEKVRRAVKGKSRWSTTVDTKDWGEPAPGFGGPRTLMIRYSLHGKIGIRAVYQGREISIP